MSKKFSGKQIFVVDDDVPSFQLIEELFSEDQLSLRHFLDGIELMKVLKDRSFPDLVIMDIHLPGADGLELTRQIKAIEPTVPVIAYTSYAMPGDREKCLRAGCDEYVSKPIDVEVFIETVTDLLATK